MIGWKQWLGAVAFLVLLFVVMFYAGFFMHGD
jgi:hypothetical protein